MSNIGRPAGRTHRTTMDARTVAMAKPRRRDRRPGALEFRHSDKLNRMRQLVRR